MALHEPFQRRHTFLMIFLTSRWLAFIYTLATAAVTTYILAGRFTWNLTMGQVDEKIETSVKCQRVKLESFLGTLVKRNFSQLAFFGRKTTHQMAIKAVLTSQYGLLSLYRTHVSRARGDTVASASDARNNTKCQKHRLPATSTSP